MEHPLPWSCCCRPGVLVGAEIDREERACEPAAYLETGQTMMTCFANAVAGVCAFGLPVTGYTQAQAPTRRGAPGPIELTVCTCIPSDHAVTTCHTQAE